MGVKERRTRILLSIFLVSDVSFSSVSLDERLQKIFDYSFNQKTKGTLAGLIKEGLIEKKKVEETGGVSVNTQVVSGAKKAGTFNRFSQEEVNQYRLAEKGFYALCLDFPFFRFLKDRWDGKWRVISYEIPEKKRELRDRLRREMQGWGLGPWHRSFWLTPHPIIDTLKALIFQKEEEKYIQAFESEHVFGDREVLIEKVWGKSQLDKKYRELFKKWHDLLSKEGDKLEKFKKIISEYIVLLKGDPGLPVDLLGANWIGFEGWSIFKEIRSILLS